MISVSALHHLLDCCCVTIDTIGALHRKAQSMFSSSGPTLRPTVPAAAPSAVPESTPAPAPPPGPDVTAIVRALSSLHESNAQPRQDSVTLFSSLSASIRAQLAMALLPPAVWPVRLPVLLDGERSIGSWVDSSPTASCAHTLVFDVIGEQIGEAGALAGGLAGLARPVRVRMNSRTSGAALPSDAVHVLCTASFTIATGQSGSSFNSKTTAVDRLLLEAVFWMLSV